MHTAVNINPINPTKGVVSDFDTTKQGIHRCRTADNVMLLVYSVSHSFCRVLCKAFCYSTYKDS